MAVAQLLQKQNFPAIAIHRGMAQEEPKVRRAAALHAYHGHALRCPCPAPGAPPRSQNASQPRPQSPARPSRPRPVLPHSYQQFKDFQRQILVATNLFGHGMDIARVNIVVLNNDMPEDSDT